MALGEHREGGHHQGEQQQNGTERFIQRFIRSFAAVDIADESSHTEQHQQPWYGLRGKAGNLSQGEGDVSKAADYAAEGEHAKQSGNPDLWTIENGKLAAKVRVFMSGHRRNQGFDPDYGNQADNRQCPEGGAPAQFEANEGAKRNADDIGDGKTGKHQRDSGAFFIARNHIRGNDRAHAEECAVAQGRNDTPKQQGFVASGHGGNKVANNK